MEKRPTLEGVGLFCFWQCYNPFVTSHPIVYRIHAIQRMFARRIAEENARWILGHGETIEDYSDEMPFPSRLISGKRGNRALHVVVAENVAEGETIVITAYEPDPAQWKSNLVERRK